MRFFARGLGWWALLAGWLAVIWVFGESQILGAPSGDIPRWLVRKGLHLLVYAGLAGVLLLRLGSRRWPGLLGVCLLVGVADELHQGLVPGRAFVLTDIGIDLVGGMLGVVVWVSALRWAGLRGKE